MDTRIGQLALARGLVSLQDLVLCVAAAANGSRALDDVLMIRGHLSHRLIEDMRAELDSGVSVSAELEHGETIVFDEIAQVRAHVETMAATPIMEGLSDATLALDGEARYAVRNELGRGGMGVVMIAQDRVLQRDVALKYLLPDSQNDKGRARLTLEAQVTGLLEHPSITPVYDMRSTATGEPFYAMRVVRERSLEAMLNAVRKGTEESPSIPFFCQVLRQVALAMQYAHDRGVVHRDLKPENILVGRYGEVYVIDWGIAKIVGKNLGLKTTEKIVMGSLIGTPRYMAPEQARGDNDAVDGRADVYALGAILYELLTLEPIFRADHVLALLFQVVQQVPEPPSERAPDRNVPRALEQICLHAVAKAPEDRFQTAQAFADEIDLFLEGVKDRERRQELAEEALMMAEQSRAVFDDVRAQYRLVVRELEEERKRVPSWARGASKDHLWQLEQQAEDLEIEIERRFSETVGAFSHALVHISDMRSARLGLARLYWERFEEAENSARLADAAYLEGLVRQYNDGQFDRMLEGNGELNLTTEPSNARVEVFRYVQQNRRLVEWLHAELESPVNDAELSHGSYVAVISAPGHRAQRLPIAMGRVADMNVHVRLLKHDEIPADFLFIPGGNFKRESGEEHVDAFAIMRAPVTVGEYLEFLNGVSLEIANAHLPRVEENEAYFKQNTDGKFQLPDEDAEGDVWRLDWPMFLVSFHDAEAFAAWRGARDKVAYRLPSALEWEKAARGVDGRVFPWGNHFDATFCCMRESHQGRPTPMPTGSYETDRSPYGLVDVAGNIAEWTSSLESADDGERGIGKGASFNSMALMCRLDMHFASPRAFRYVHYGFRLAMDVPHS
jgi:serine/threonine protein kinase